MRRSTKNLFSVLLLTVLFCLCGSSLAFTIPAQADHYVNDYAGMLSPATALKLNNELSAFDNKTTTQIVVATFPSLQGQSLEDTSLHIAEQWKIGSKQYDNGVLLVIFKKEHKIRIEVGYGLEDRLTDALSAQIIRDAIAPAFRAGNYDKGVAQAVNDMMLATKGEYHAKKPSTPFFSIFCTIVFLFMCVYLVLHSIYHFFKYGFKHHPGAGYWLSGGYVHGDGTTGLFGNSSGGSGSSGGFFSGGGGSFGGGGGSFGGGGASGGW